MSEKNNELARVESEGNSPVKMNVFGSTSSFEKAQRMARLLASSKLVPNEYRGVSNEPNCVIAIDMANRLGLPPIMVMQNLNVINGKPGWSSTYIISQINSHKRFRGSLRFIYGDDRQSCRAVIKDAEGEMVEGQTVTIAMAKAEGWFGKTGSKWPNMPEQMLAYRAAAFFARLYCPEVLIGLLSVEEVMDITYEEDVAPPTKIEDLNKAAHDAAELSRQKENDYEQMVVGEISQPDAERGQALCIYIEKYHEDPAHIVPTDAIWGYREYLSNNVAINGEQAAYDLFGYVAATKEIAARKAAQEASTEPQKEATSEPTKEEGKKPAAKKAGPTKEKAEDQPGEHDDAV